MSTFDSTGGPFEFWLRPSMVPPIGINVYFAPSTWSNQPQEKLQGTIPYKTLWVGRMASGDVNIQTHNWYNQGAAYRSVVANCPAYPDITVVEYSHLHALKAFLPELVITNQGEVDMGTLLPLLANSAITGNPMTSRDLLSLLSSCAASVPQRTQLASALSLSTSITDILIQHGVLLSEEVGGFSPADLSALDAMLRIYPDPIKDQLHLLIMDESSGPGSGGYTSGGIINIAGHATTLVGFVPYPSGSALPGINDLQRLLVHEMGHMAYFTSVGLEKDRYLTIYNSGATDPNAFLYQTIDRTPTEEIIKFWLGYCTDSTTILNEVALRQNTVLTQKLSHTIDLLPSLAPGKAPFFTTDPTTHVTSVSYVPVTRGPSRYLGDDGMITSVNGIVF